MRVWDIYSLTSHSHTVSDKLEFPLAHSHVFNLLLLISLPLAQFSRTHPSSTYSLPLAQSLQTTYSYPHTQVHARILGIHTQNIHPFTDSGLMHIFSLIPHYLSTHSCLHKHIQAYLVYTYIQASGVKQAMVTLFVYMVVTDVGGQAWQGRDRSITFTIASYLLNWTFEGDSGGYRR